MVRKSFALLSTAVALVAAVLLCFSPETQADVRRALTKAQYSSGQHYVAVQAQLFQLGGSIKGYAEEFGSRALVPAYEAAALSISYATRNASRSMAGFITKSSQSALGAVNAVSTRIEETRMGIVSYMQRKHMLHPIFGAFRIVLTRVEDARAGILKYLQIEPIAEFLRLAKLQENAQIAKLQIAAARDWCLVEATPLELASIGSALLLGFTGIMFLLSRRRRRASTSVAPADAVVSEPVAVDPVAPEMSRTSQSNPLRRRRAESPSARVQNDEHVLPAPVVPAADIRPAHPPVASEALEQLPSSQLNLRRPRAESPAVRVKNDENTRPVSGNLDLLYRLNTASKESLERMPGLGEKSVQKLLDYRNKSGELSCVEDLSSKVKVHPTAFANFKRAHSIQGL